MNQLKKTLAFILFAFCTTGIYAQDILILKNGDEIPVKVSEIGVKEVKYKKFDNQSGPTYTAEKSDIFMIKYENGDKDMFENGTATREVPIERNESVQNVVTNQGFTQDGTTPPQYTEPKEIPTRKAYIGIGVGGAFLTESYDNVSGGIQANVNFGYLFSKNVGITASVFTTSFDLSNYRDTSIGLTGFMVGPLFSTSLESQIVEFDLRPTVGFSFGSVSVGSVSGDTDENAFSFGIGGSARWNCGSRISLSGNVDYYRGVISDVDLSSVGITVGVNFRF